MKVVITNLPSKVIFAYDGDMLLVNRERFKEVMAHATGRTIGEVFEEVFSERGLRRENYPKLSYQCVNIPELVEK